MIRSEIVVTIPGHPAPKGSLKCIGGRGGKGHVLIEDNAKTAPWRAEVVRAIQRVTQAAEPRQPLSIEVSATIERPPSHYGTVRNAKRLKPSAPVYPSTHGTGDVDKLARLILDAIQDTHVMPDDAQVVELISRKRYPTADENYDDALPYPGVRIRITPI